MQKLAKFIKRVWKVSTYCQLKRLGKHTYARSVYRSLDPVCDENCRVMKARSGFGLRRRDVDERPARDAAERVAIGRGEIEDPAGKQRGLPGNGCRPAAPLG